MTLLLTLKEQTTIIRQGNIILQELTMVSSWQPEKKKKIKALSPQAKEENFVNNQWVWKRTRAL